MCSLPSLVFFAPVAGVGPWMIRPRRDRAPGWGHRLGRDRLYGPRRDRVKVERPTLVRDPQGPLYALFHQHMGRPHIGPHLIEVPVVRHRPITAQASSGFDAQALVEIAARRTGAMQIGGLGRRNGEAPIVARQIARQELIRRRQRGNVREPQLLDHPILKGFKEPLHPGGIT
jgi:hypothetical protein